MAIGSVAVDVVPDAEGFWKKFEAKTRAGADAAGAKAGKALGKSLGDTAAVEARARLDAGLKNLKANVDLDTTKAEAQALALRRTLDKAGDSKGVDKQRKSVGLLSTALFGLATAAVPVAGVATGAVIGLGAAAGVAVVGILGIRDAMKSGTPLGQQYQKAFAPLTAEFKQMKQIGAAGLFKGINAGVKGLQPLFPTLNRDVALFSSQMGTVAGHVGPGLAALFTRLNPLFETMGSQLVHGSQSFEQWATSSQSVGRFVAYVQTTLPQVEQTVGALITTISHVAVAAEGFGGTTLTTIRLLSSAINAIPVGQLQVLVPLLLGLKVGNTLSKSLDNAGTGLAGFATKLSKGKDVASKASGLFGKLGGAVGKLGPYGLAAGLALGGLAAVLGRGKQAAAEATKRVNDYTQALQDNTVAQTAQAEFQQSGALKAATDLGISQKQLIQSVTNQGGAYQKTSAQLSSLTAEYKTLDDIHQKFLGSGAQDADLTSAQFKRYEQLGGQIAKVSTAVAQQYDAYQKAKIAIQQQAKTLGDSALAAAVADGSYLRTAKSLGTTGGAYLSAKLAADQQTQSTKSATLAMQEAGDTAGLLKQALDGLAGKALSVGEAQTQLASSLTAAKQAWKDNGHTIDLNTAKGQANRSAIEQIANSNKTLVASQLQGVKSGKDANAIIDKANATFTTNAAKIYGAGTAADKYALKVGKIPHVAATDPRFNDQLSRARIAAYTAALKAVPKSVQVSVKDNATTQLEKIKANLAALRNKTIDISTYVHNVILPTVRTQSGSHDSRAPGGAAGGHLPEGWFTVGEGNPNTWELGHKRGSQVDIYPNSMARQMMPSGPTGAKIPGFAGGTITHSRLGWEYGGTIYSSQRAAVNAQHKAEQKNAAPVDRTFTGFGGTVREIVGQIRRDTPIAAAAMRGLAKAMGDAFRLRGVDRELGSARAKLAGLRQASAQLASDTTGNLRQSFDVATAGADSTGGYVPTGQAGYKDILGAFTSQTSSASRFASQLTKLSREGLNKSYLAALSRNGPSSTLDSLATLSKAQILNVSKAYAQYETTTSRVGQIAGQDVYGTAIKAQAKTVAALAAKDVALRKDIARLIAGVERLTHHTTVIELDGKTIARAVALANAKNARR